MSNTAERIDLETLVAVASRGDGAARHLLAIVGAPGSGKSTLADALLARLDPGTAAILPMDGFHYDDAVLAARGLLPRKGAPDTFDAGGLRHLLARLRARDEAEVAVPVFDRTLEIARAGARLIPRAVRTVIVEGNYLLLSTPPWSGLHAAFDTTVMVEVDEAELRRRLVARWQGFGLAAAEIERRVETNDLPNGRRVRADSVAADYVLGG